MTDFMRANDPEWLKRAFGDEGLDEVSGNGATARIVEMYAKAGHPEVKSDEVAWCSAAANTWMVEGGLRGTGSLAARSWLNWGRKLDHTKALPRGAVLIFKRGNSSWQGHVCFLLQDNGSTLRVLGGNQRDSVCEATMSRSTLIGARWPDTVQNSRTLQAQAASFVSFVSEKGAGNIAAALEENSDIIAENLGKSRDVVQQYAAT